MSETENAPTEAADDDVTITQETISTGFGYVDGWIAELDGTTGIGHGREQALRQLAMNLWRESL